MVYVTPLFPVCQRVTFKTVVRMWKCLHDTALCYLANLCVLASFAAGHRQSYSTVWFLWLSWCPGPRHLLASAALLCMASDPGIDYLCIFDYQNCCFSYSSTCLRPTLPALVCWLLLCMLCTIIQSAVTVSKFGANYSAQLSSSFLFSCWFWQFFQVLPPRFVPCILYPLILALS